MRGRHATRCGSREGRSDGTDNANIAVYIGLGRAISGALIRGPHTGTSKGEVALTLLYLWDFVILRIANFQRLKVAI